MNELAGQHMESSLGITRQMEYERENSNKKRVGGIILSDHGNGMIIRHRKARRNNNSSVESPKHEIKYTRIRNNQTDTIKITSDIVPRME